MRFEVDTKQEAGGQVRLAIRGDVNIQTSPELRKALKPYLAKHVKSIHIELNDVPFMDSSGIATLVEGLQWSHQTGGEFVLSGMQETVQDVFSLAKLDTVFTIQDKAEL